MQGRGSWILAGHCPQASRPKENHLHLNLLGRQRQPPAWNSPGRPDSEPWTMWVPEQQRGNSRHCFEGLLRQCSAATGCERTRSGGEASCPIWWLICVSMLLFYCLLLPSPGGSVRMMLLFKIVCHICFITTYKVINTRKYSLPLNQMFLWSFKNT